jgi:hypothetical protein
MNEINKLILGDKGRQRKKKKKTLTGKWQPLPWGIYVPEVGK